MCKFFSKIFKILWLLHFCRMSSPLPKFWRRHCSTGLERNSCMKFCLKFLPIQKSWSRYWYSSVILLTLIIILVLYAVNAYPNLKSKVRLCVRVHPRFVANKIIWKLKITAVLSERVRGSIHRSESGRVLILPLRHPRPAVVFMFSVSCSIFIKQLILLFTTTHTKYEKTTRVIHFSYD